MLINFRKENYLILFSIKVGLKKHLSSLQNKYKFLLYPKLSTCSIFKGFSRFPLKLSRNLKLLKPSAFFQIERIEAEKFNESALRNLFDWTKA